MNIKVAIVAKRFLSLRIGGIRADWRIKLFYFQREVGCQTAKLGVKRSRRFHALTSLAELLLQYPALHSFA